MRDLDFGAVAKRLRENKYVLLVALLGLILILLPGKNTKENAETVARPTQSASPGKGDPLSTSGIPLDTESERLGVFLSEISGVGETKVLLSSGGAIVVCAGADRAEVQLKVTNAVSAYTGLGSDKIRVMKLK